MRDAGQPEEAIRSFRQRVSSGWSAVSRRCCRAPSSSRPATWTRSSELPDADCRRRARSRGGDQAERRPGDDDGAAQSEVARRGARGTVVPRHHHRPDARAATAVRRAPAARADEQPGHARGDRCARSSPIRSSTSVCRLDFLQSMVPKLDAESLAPVSWPQEPALEWYPPGHGDVYPARCAARGCSTRCSSAASATR